MTSSGSFEVRNNTALMATVYIALFKTIGELQRERLHQLRAIVFTWNGRTQG